MVPANVRLVKVAIPLDAEIVVVPPSVPPDAVATIKADDDSTKTSFESRTLTMGCVARLAPAPLPTGCVVTESLVAVPDTFRINAVEEVCVSVDPSSVVVAIARTLYLPAASTPVVHDHDPGSEPSAAVTEFAVQADPVSVHVPVEELESESLERVAMEIWIDDPTGADPVNVNVLFEVRLSVLDDPLSDVLLRSGSDTAGNE